MIRRLIRAFPANPARPTPATLTLVPLEERVTPTSLRISHDGPVNEGGVLTFTITHDGVAINYGGGGGTPPATRAFGIELFPSGSDYTLGADVTSGCLIVG